jgi:thimet oligopeptidase
MRGSILLPLGAATLLALGAGSGVPAATAAGTPAATNAPTHAAKQKAALPASARSRASAPAAAIDDNAPFWSAKPNAKQFAALQDRRIARAKASIAKLVAVKGPRTLDNTLAPYDEAFRQLDMAGAQTGLMQSVHPDSTLRASAEKAQQAVEAYATDLSLDRRVYDALSALDLSSADPETKYYVTRTLRDFRLAGVDKDPATRAKVKKLNAELVEIGQEFDRNIREDKPTVVAKSVAELDGLPKDYIDRHKPAADGSITLTIEYPDALPVLSYAKNGDLRKRMYMAYSNRAYPKNIDVLNRMIERRSELARLLGYPDWADYITADKMVGSAKNAREFIEGVVQASGDRNQREYQQLLEQKKKDVPGATAVEFWENNYYQEQVRKSDYNFDSQSVRPYFPFAEVQQGLLDVTSRMFGVEYRKVEHPAVWDPSVDCYEVYDGAKLVGRFYLDLHPRPDKYNHAAEFDIRTGVEGRQIPEACLVCNLPGGQPGDPGLMESDDVTTFFHEFGHLLHALFAGHHRWVGIGGIRTEQDFVEAPSQMLEEWTRSPAVLATFAKHYQTGEPIPAEVVKQMNRANDFGKGLMVRRQMVYADVSLSYYDRDPKSFDTTELAKSIVEKYQPFPYAEGTHFQTAFGHLDGYSAVYYTYMWSLVIAKDMFAQFDQDHLLEPGVATRYRDCVLAPGGSEPAHQLVECFLGRPFNNQAWKKWLDEN